MNEIILDKKTGQLKNVILYNGDCSKATANMTGEIKMINNEMKLMLAISLNDKFQIKFE